MKKRFEIPTNNGTTRVINFDFSKSKSYLYHIENVCVIKIYKYSNHSYNLKFFSYKTLNIYTKDNIFTQKKMYYILQNLLQNNL